MILRVGVSPNPGTLRIRDCHPRTKVPEMPPSFHTRFKVRSYLAGSRSYLDNSHTLFSMVVQNLTFRVSQHQV